MGDTEHHDERRLARHLDGASAHDLLSVATRAAGASLRDSRLRSVHHRTGRSYSQVHEAVLDVAGRTAEVLLVAHVDVRGFPPDTFCLDRDDDRVAVWRFPHDPYLPGLPSAVDPRRVRELLDLLQAPVGSVTLHTRAYRPSRRAVVEVRIQGPEAAGRILYLKVLSGRRATELATIHRALAPHVPVPAVLGVADEQGIVALEALGGATLRQALVAGSATPDAAELVEYTQRLASSGLRSRRDPRRFADARRHVAGLRALVPDLGDDIGRIAAAAVTIDGPVVPVHGDLHDGQLLLGTDGRVTGLLDVDGAGDGLVAQDAGSLIAHLAAVGEVWPAARDRAEALAASVEEAFRPVVGPDALRRAVAGAWLALATGPHRAQDADWEEHTRRRIARAARELEGR
jgi:hypothetical protein